MELICLKTELRQELKLTPQLIQSMEILQMDSQELLEYLSRTMEENPVLEQEENHQLLDSYAQLRNRASWIDAGIGGTTLSCDQSAFPEQGRLDWETESLSGFLCDQLERKHLSKPLLALSQYIAKLVDNDGYLTSEDLDSIASLNVPNTLIQQALETVQRLEPAGVGARSLEECLLLQLMRRQDAPSAVTQIITRFLPQLSKCHYGLIAQELGLKIEEVRAAETVIASLDPYPGRAFQNSETTMYTRPDLFVVETDDELEAVLNEYYLPRVFVSDYYVRLLKESDEKDTRDYLRTKMQQANWLLRSLERRGSTLQQCADAILSVQHDFFSGRSETLVPMSISQLADLLSLHPSTVSRAVHGKYLQCRQGTFPLRYFFTLSVGPSGHSTHAVKRKLLELVKNENPARPLSDQQLCARLEQDGVQIARRTVAKYRMELGIHSSSVRKHKPPRS